MTSLTKRQKLAQMLKNDRILLAPAAFDALSARMIEFVGFDVVWVSGASLCNALLGCPDIGIASYAEIFTTWQHINAATGLPVIVDADTGFGGLFNTYRMMRELEEAGIAGLQIEDQTFPKRCGHFKGVGVVPMSEMEKRVKAVLKARTDPDFLVIGRTDSTKSVGFDEALTRARQLWEMGVDMVFLSALQDEEQLGKIMELGIPACCDIIESTTTGKFTAKQMEAFGFKIVKYPQSLIRASMKAMKDILESVKATGGTAATEASIATAEERNTYTNKDLYEELGNCFETTPAQ